jgi:hypothetical protein
LQRKSLTNVCHFAAKEGSKDGEDGNKDGEEARGNDEEDGDEDDDEDVSSSPNPRERLLDLVVEPLELGLHGLL